MHSEVCPVCHGTGKIEDKLSTAGKVVCHGCGGKGWIEVSNSQSPIPYVTPFIPAPYHYPYCPYPYPYPGNSPYFVCINL